MDSLGHGENARKVHATLQKLINPCHQKKKKIRPEPVPQIANPRRVHTPAPSVLARAAVPGLYSEALGLKDSQKMPSIGHG